jgi:ribosome-associated toxin RatA of RatAB toxin-antitoxin module
MAQAEQEKVYDVSAEKFFQAVAGYEKYPEFVDGMKKVKAERQADGSVLATYDFSMMSKDMSYTLRILENPAAGEVSWTLVKSDFFKVNNGAWRIQSTGPNSCKVRYSLEVDFSFSVPSFILKGVVKGTLPSMMNSFYERARKS